MSGEEIRSTETEDSSRLANEDGERLIQMLSVIASNVDRAYPEGTEIVYNHDNSVEGATIVTSADHHGFNPISNILTTITVPSSDGHGPEVIPTIVQVDNSVTMVQHEVVVGTPDLSLTSADPAISIHPLQTSDIHLDTVHHIQPTEEPDVEPDPEQSKQMIFMTNYRDYTIVDIDGRICIGEEDLIVMANPGCKMVPVTDVSTGQKFEYQYRPRVTVKRHEGQDLVVYFIGQVSNERIRALYYQIIFQLTFKIGKIDLDMDYTSGKRVISEYYSSFPPSKAPTVKTPNEKKTYMKLLFHGDMEDTKELIYLDENDLEPVQPSEKLKKSKLYKEKTEPEEPPETKKESQKSETIILVEEKSAVAETSPNQNTEIVIVSNERDQVLPEQEPLVQKKKRGRPRKVRPTDSAQIPKTPSAKQSIQDGVNIEKEKSPGEQMSAIISRGSNKRKVKVPSKLRDYYDFTKKRKMDASMEDDEAEESDSSDKDFKPSNVPSAKKQKVESSDISQKTSELSNITVETVDTVNDANMTTESNPQGPLTDIEKSSEIKLDEKLASPSISTDQVTSVKNRVQFKLKYTPSVGPKPADGVKKRGRGRPRKNPKEDPLDRVEDIDELVLQRKKYPSCQFQRAAKTKKYLCQACLTNHEKPVALGDDPDKCPIVHPKVRFEDQHTNTDGSSACSLMSLPTSLSVKVSSTQRRLTVCAGQDIQPYTEFGPLVGILFSEDDINTDLDLSHLWFLLQEEEGEKFYLYTGNENASNWCHYLTPVPPTSPYNTVMVLREEGIFFVTSQKVSAGTELKVHIPYFGNKTRPLATMYQSECLHCNHAFSSSIDYQKHYHIFHPGGFTKQKQKCRLCNLSFPGMRDLQLHMDKKHDGQGAFLCDQCSRSFPNPARLRMHQADVHPPAEAAVKCNKCNKVYRSKRALMNHNTNVHSEFKFACETCGKWFDRRSTLLRHQRLHTGKFSHFCERCGKGFRDLHNLKVHTLTHSGVRPFSCTYCANCSFSTRTCLKIHYERFHKMTEDMMPELTRNIPFTMEAYSGTLPPVDKPIIRPQPKVIRVTAGKHHTLIQDPQHSGISIIENITGRVDNAKDETDTYTDNVTQHHVELETLDQEPPIQVLPGQSLLRNSTTEPPREVHLHIEDDSNTMHIEHIDKSQDGDVKNVPMVVEDGMELVETEQVTEGDHCYYALNVDGQQVLVPATEEVCVIVENDNILKMTNGN